MALWSTRPGRTAVDVRVGGAGNVWQVLDTDASIDAPTGGGQDVESRWGRNERGELEYVGLLVQGNPARITFSIMARLKSERFLANLTKLNCPVDVRARLRCGDLNDVNDYTEALVYYDAVNTEGPHPSDQPVFGTEDTDNDIQDQWAMSAGFQDRWVRLTHIDITQQWSDFPFNRVISVGKNQCYGDCGGSTTVDDEFWAVTDKDNTPGYLGQATPLFYYTLDGGVTWVGGSGNSYIAPFTNGDALDVAKAGSYVLAASNANGIAYALIEDIKNNVAQPWSAASGISTQFPRRIFVVHAGLIFACGGGGYIWRSTDGGLTWTVLSAGTITTQQLNAIWFVDENLGWFVGNSGAIVKYVGGTLSLSPIVGVSSNFNAVTVPKNRGREVHVGAANGNIYKSVNTGRSFTAQAFTESGSGTIVDIQPGGFRGSVLFILQQNAAGKTRVLRDESGGAYGSQVRQISSYTDPGNSGLNSIAPSGVNFALVVGEKNLTFGAISRITRNPVN